jgi:acetylornithine/N-succinyldiaminopimelate aminotransferase
MAVDDASFIPESLIKKGVLINCTQKNILRIMPPITVTQEEIDEAIDKFSEVLEEM